MHGINGTAHFGGLILFGIGFTTQYLPALRIKFETVAGTQTVTSGRNNTRRAVGKGYLAITGMSLRQLVIDFLPAGERRGERLLHYRRIKTGKFLHIRTNVCPDRLALIGMPPSSVRITPVLPVAHAPRIGAGTLQTIRRGRPSSAFASFRPVITGPQRVGMVVVRIQAGSVAFMAVPSSAAAAMTATMFRLVLLFGRRRCGYSRLFGLFRRLHLRRGGNLAIFAVGVRCRHTVMTTAVPMPSMFYSMSVSLAIGPSRTLLSAVSVSGTVTFTDLNAKHSIEPRTIP